MQFIYNYKDFLNYCASKSLRKQLLYLFHIRKADYQYKNQLVQNVNKLLINQNYNSSQKELKKKKSKQTRCQKFRKSIKSLTQKDMIGFSSDRFIYSLKNILKAVFCFKKK
ncbi:hypothetical protein TTHERM_000181049 (macronuclear) [Tetrahymena thermophila SB210]|uniref:Uncharacterized protein n=1 Tax=Tetrahymena thermophila (strain SB210) TaxID=312017 RepID=W7XK50_TETTS|nr:hypothetical protein TTHERM_000181049 [Tetrahymena thermophila SB210]EWS76216.1 hypothetical protein TTHERM_000181049 [Tetrahymena thermophila SB210]|eukprot:XP_012651263.1 hypothetical protein TTHERM_000181049 [Tetrahymena thermophila SB210]